MKVLVCFILTYRANPGVVHFMRLVMYRNDKFNSIASTKPILFCSTLNMEVSGEKKVSAMEGGV